MPVPKTPDARIPSSPTTPRPRKRLRDAEHHLPPRSPVLAWPFPSAQPSPVRACPEPTPSPPDRQIVGQVVPSSQLNPPVGATPPAAAVQWTVDDFAAFRREDNFWVVNRPPSGWRSSIARLVEGYTDNIGRGYDAAVVTETGCIIAQKAANRAVNGYCQVTYTTARSQKGKGKEKPRGAHWIVCVLEKRYGFAPANLNALTESVRRR